MAYTYSIVVGDWSGDGHGHKDTFIFSCSHTKKDIQEAYLKAVKKSGISLHDPHKKQEGVKVVLSEFEDCYIQHEDFQKLLEMGVDQNKLNIDLYDDQDEESKIGVQPEGVAQLFLEMAKTQLEGFEYEILDPSRVNVGNGFMGYGCYMM